MNDLQSTFLILSASFPPTATASSILFRDNFENCCSFSLRPVKSSCLWTLVVFIPESKNWQCFSRLLSRHFPPCFNRAVVYPEQGTCNRPFSSSPGPLYHNEVKCSAIDKEMIFYSHANKTHSQEMLCTCLILKVRVFGTRKWPNCSNVPCLGYI